MQVQVRVIPNASRSEVVGWHAPGVLKVKVTAAPEGGRANREVLRLLAKKFELGRHAVTLTSGEKSRLKTVQLSGLEEIVF